MKVDVIPRPALGGDDWAHITRTFGSLDTVYFSFRFRATADVDSTAKFWRVYDTNGVNLGGLWYQDGQLHWGWDILNGAIITPINCAVTLNTWHRIKVRYTYNGSTWPKVKVWWNGAEAYYPDGQADVYWAGASGNDSFWLDKELHAGQRVGTHTPYILYVCPTLNEGNTTTGQINFDDVNISSSDFDF